MESDLQYRGLFGAATGQSTLTAGASAIARITGAGVPAVGYTWPTMRHFNASDFQEQCQPLPVGCDPTRLPPVTFWSSSGSQQDIVFGKFKALIDFSRYSPNINRNAAPADKDKCTNVPDAGCVPQLMKGLGPLEQRGAVQGESRRRQECLHAAGTRRQMVLGRQ